MQKMTLNEGDVLVITVDTDNMPRNVAQQYMDQVLTTAKVYFFSTQIYVVPKGVEFSVITPYRGDSVES